MAFIGGSDTDREQVGAFQVFLVRRAKVEQFFTPLFICRNGLKLSAVGCIQSLPVGHRH